MRIQMLLGLSVIAALVTLAIFLWTAIPSVYSDGDDNLPSLPDKRELKYPNLGSSLDQLVTSVEQGNLSAKEAADDAPVYQEESIAVTIYLSGNMDDVVEFLEKNGGSPRNVGEDYIEAYVPMSLLGQVSEQPGVIRVREITPPEPAQTSQQVAGHGPTVHGSTTWNQSGFSGQGVKVGIIDYWFGFNDFSSLMGTELPSTVQSRCYTDVGKFTSNIADCGNAVSGSNHGTRLAEAVMDIAPQATLYIASPRSKGDTNSAVDWMVSQGVSVIISGEAFPFDGPGDGTSPFSDSPLKTVDRAVAGGAVWVNSAGNQALSTWFGTYSIVTSGSSRFLAFDGVDIANGMALEAGDRIIVELRWEDSWSAANRDLNLFVFDHATQLFAASSFDPQLGVVGQVPFEVLTYTISRDGQYSVGVAHQSGSAPRWIQVTVWGVGSIEHYTESGSIGNPSESANSGMLAVGAAHWNNVSTIEPYSSRGPTPDGRLKPEIVGADCGATSLRPLNASGNGFCGTSQSAAHVAGMATLVRQRFSTYTPAQVADYLKEHAEQRGTLDPNNTWGHGFAQLPTVSECSDAVPNAVTNPGLVSDCEALLAARDTLAGSGPLNWSGTTAIASWDGVTVGGSPLRVTDVVLRDSQLTGTIPPELGRLANLAGLDLGGNQLTGPIPSALASLTNLEILSLTQNQLSGPIPPGFSALTNLEILALGGNQLTGSVPTWLGTLTDLQGLYLWGNQLTGQIPSQLASLTNLQRLSLHTNQLTGQIPTWLGGLTNLEWLYLSRNQLTGQIPSQLASLTKLERLSLSANQLTGPIPTWLGGLTNLEWLNLSRNQLTGQIPSQLASLTKLERLSLSANQLTGPIPTWLGGLTNLEWLHLSRNQLTGEIPAELGRLAKLTVLHLSGNQLTGCVPARLRDVADNDFAQLGLPFCGGAQGVPAISSVTPGPDFLTVTWAAPGGSGITAYDLRHIETSADETVDANWTVVDSAWTAGSGALSYRIPGLANGTRYDVQVRAVTASGDGPWSATATGTPALPTGASATRSFSPATVAPGGRVTVTITVANYGLGGGVTETLPAGFSYVSSSLDSGQVNVTGQQVRFTFLAGGTPFTYTVTASSVEGPHAFSGTLRDSERNDHTVGGASTVTVSSGDPLVARYDANKNGKIEKSEVITAINEYLFGTGADVPSKADVIKLINLYLFGPGG